MYVNGKISASRELSYGGIDVGFENRITHTINRMVNDPTIKDKSFMRVKGRVQVSTYRLRTTELHVSDYFLEHVKKLPLEYEKVNYFAFLEDYGTHYSKAGILGGQYNLIYVLHPDIIKGKSMYLSKRIVLSFILVPPLYKKINVHVSTMLHDSFRSNIERY